MALTASFIWKNPDATEDLNNRIRRIVSRGIVWGGALNPAPSGLQVIVDPAVAVSFDGMTIGEDAQETLTVAANARNYVVLWAKYNEGGVPATPTLTYQVMDEAAYLAHPEKDYLIVYGVADVPPAAVNVTLADIDLTVRDEIDPLGRDWYRGKVANPAALPVPPPDMNRIGDFYFVDSDNTFHFWTGTMWEPLNTGSFNTETETMNEKVLRAERERIVEGSGVLSGIRPGPGADASDPEVGLVETASIADQIAVDTFSAVVNGHMVELHGRNVALATKPGGGFRYDIIFLEVWREAIAVPDTFDYDRNPDGAAQYTLEELDDKLEQLDWTAGIPVAPTADNFNVNPIESRSHDWRVVKYRLAWGQNLPSTEALYNPASNAIASACLNLDGNPFAAQPAGSGMDDRIWMATSATSSDGYSWAIPLFVLRRVSTEDHTINNAVKVFRDGVRHVFPVYPTCDVAHTSRTTTQNVHSAEPAPFGIGHLPHKKPSGFMGAFAEPLSTQGAANTLRVATRPFKFRIRGIEDDINDVLAGGDVDVGIGLPPAALNTWARTLIYLKMNITLYNNEPGAAVTSYYQSLRHRPFIPSDPGGTIRGQGWKRGYVAYQFEAYDLGAVDYRDEVDAMNAAGWTTGDVTMVGSGLQYEDGGLWSRALAIDADDRVHPFLAEWAIPVCVVHRRNTQTWAFDTNPNGSGGRPDGRTDATLISPDDLVDLRHRVGVTEAQYKSVLDESVDKAMKGQLRTRLANKYLGAGTSGNVAGSRILQTDYVGNSGGGAFDLTAPDGNRRVWSDAKEFALVSMDLDLSVAPSSSDLHDWAVAGNIGTLTIKAPTGAHLVRHVPACLYAVGDSTDPTFLDFYGPPLWSTRFGTNPFIPAHAYASTIDGSNQVSSLDFWHAAAPGSITVPPYLQPFEVVPGTLDDQGRATEMTGYVDMGSSSGTAVLSWWVHYDRTFTGTYSANYGLAEIPDVVHQVTLDPSGAAEAVHVGPIHATVRKSVVASSSIVITSADVTAVTGTPGTVKLWGINPDSVRSEPDYSALLDTIELTHTTQDSITITLTGPYSGELAVDVLYESDLDKWVEVGRGGKSVQAMFSWGYDDTIDLGATPPAVSEYSFSIGSSVWTPLALDRDVESQAAPLVFTRAAPASDWTQLPTAIGALVPYPYSNMISITELLPVLEQYVMVVWPDHAPLSVGETLQIDYTYTPYQGLSSTGGSAPITAVAVPALKSLLHGRVEENTDFYATQSGPASYFSGVNAFTGAPANNTADLASATAISLGDDRMSIYNRTALVSPDAPYGVQPSSSLPRTEQERLNAACVLRLPYPMDPAMLRSNVPNYHSSVMEFDLDPLRAGAASGYIQCAPGYPNTAYTASAITATRQAHQFVNGLTPLRVGGGVHYDNASYVASPDRYAVGQTAASSNLSDGFRWKSNASGNVLSQFVSFDGPLDANILRTMTFFESDDACSNGGALFYAALTRNFLPTSSLTDVARYTLDTATPTNQMTGTSRTPFTGGVLGEYMFVTYPGVVQEYARRFGIAGGGIGNELQVTLYLLNNPGSVVGHMYETEFTAAIENAHFLPGRVAGVGRKKVVDVLRLPFASYEVNDVTRFVAGQGGQNASGVSSLRGLDVQYPDSWADPTKVKVEGLLQRSYNGRGAGRGLYLGSTEQRYCMPMFLPGCGTNLLQVLRREFVVVDDQEAPPSFPYMPADSIFDQSPRTYLAYDIGGPIAYVFFGALMRPSSVDHRNKMVMQISGGPTGSIDASNNLASYTPEDLDGNAIDAFWPIGRPLFDPVE
jgi:hypothetical protein